MAIVPHRMWAWVSQATADDRRTGLVEMTRGDFLAAQAQGRAQDPRVGALNLKFITRELYVPPEPPEPPEPEPEPEAQSLGAAATPTRRRRASSRA